MYKRQQLAASRGELAPEEAHLSAYELNRMDAQAALAHRCLLYTSEPVVRDITLYIPDGCFVGITGAAGSGKSTLTYAINGIIPHCYPGDFYGSVTVELSLIHI